MVYRSLVTGKRVETGRGSLFGVPMNGVYASNRFSLASPWNLVGPTVENRKRRHSSLESVESSLLLSYRYTSAFAFASRVRVDEFVVVGQWHREQKSGLRSRSIRASKFLERSELVQGQTVGRP